MLSILYLKSPSVNLSFKSLYRISFMILPELSALQNIGIKPYLTVQAVRDPTKASALNLLLYFPLSRFSQVASSTNRYIRLPWLHARCISAAKRLRSLVKHMPVRPGSSSVRWRRPGRSARLCRRAFHRSETWRCKCSRHNPARPSRSARRRLCTSDAPDQSAAPWCREGSSLYRGSVRHQTESKRDFLLYCARNIIHEPVHF